MVHLCEEDQLKPALREGTIEFWKTMPMETIPQCQTGCAQDTVNVWVNIRLRVCVFYPETREIKASICSDGYTCERIASSGNYGIQTRFEEDYSRQGMP